MSLHYGRSCMRDNSLIDEQGYRPNVGIMLANAEGRLLWARRIGQDAWQFPQGGIQHNESAEQAMFRELHEEVGLHPEQVRVMAATRSWLRYRLPGRHRRADGQGNPCIGQKQKWFLLQLLADDSAVCLTAGQPQEFDAWRWVSYWYPLGQVVVFKREVYRRALKELAPVLARLDAGRATG